MTTPIHDSIFAGLFVALQNAMKIPHVTDPTPSQKTRVIWSLTGAPTSSPARYQAPREKRIALLAWPHTATVYGSSQIEVQHLVAQLLGHIDRFAGPPRGRPALGDGQGERFGYEVQAGRIAGIAGGDGVAAGYACDVAVTLFQPVSSHIHPPATVQTASVSISAPTDSTAEEGIAWTSAGS